MYANVSPFGILTRGDFHTVFKSTGQEERSRKSSETAEGNSEDAEDAREEGSCCQKYSLKL